MAEMPEWMPFAPGASPWTPEPHGRGRVVVALAPAITRRDRWSGPLVLDLADRWADAGHRVVLADAVFEHPMLHRLTGLPNGEGLSDAVLFGASVTHVARAVPDRSFLFVGAGSPVGDPDRIVAAPRWRRLREAFRDASVTLVLVIREGCAAETDAIDDCDDLIVLGEAGEELPSAARVAAHKMRLFVGPPAGPEGTRPGVETAGPGILAEDPVAFGGPLPEANPDVPWAEFETGAGEGQRGFTLSEGGTRIADAGVGQTEDAPSPVEAGVAPGGGAVPEDAPEPALVGSPVDVGARGARVAPVRSARGSTGQRGGRKLTWLLIAALVLAILVFLGGLGRG